jgi:hypothetical protein
VVESGGNSHIRNTGYKKRHNGAFQVNSKLHGRVSPDPVEQARQAEAILIDLTKTYPSDIHKVLNSYGGDTRGKYAITVLNELTEVPQ